MMKAPRIQPVLDWLRQAVTQPQDELDRWERSVRFAYDLGRYGARQLRRDQAPRMAAALSFRTLFGILPVLVVATLLVKAIGGLSEFRESVETFLGAYGLDRFQTAANGEAGEQSVSLSQWLIDNVFSQIEQINVAAITWVGVAVLIYAAISLMVTIEGCFNTIYRAPEGRSWSRRIPVYWTVLTLAPAVVMMTLYVDRRFGAFLTEQVGWSWALRIAPVVWSFVATWLVMFAIYKLLPSTRVHTRPALGGAFVAAILLEVGKRTMGAYLSKALAVKLIYGSLGLIPVFMFWMYLMWLVILFGLEVSATLQMLAGRRLDEIEHRGPLSGLADPAMVITVTEVVAERFRASAAATARQVADATGLAEQTVSLILDRLVEAGVLHRLDREDEAVSLARPADQISAAELIDVGFALIDDGQSGRESAIVRRLRGVQRRIASRTTLAGLIDGPSAAPSS
jgi:membrane protein